MKSINSISEFEKTIDVIYGVYLDSTSGFKNLRQQFEQRQQESLQSLKDTHPELATIEYLDQTHFIYGKGNPNLPDAIELHRCTQGQYKERNSEAGLNFLFIGNMTLVSIYQFWEDYYRAEIATLLGITKNDLKEPIMGDIRLIRHSIIHHAGIALADIRSCEVLTWFHEGDIIFLDKKKFETVIYEIKKMVLHLKAKLDDLQ